jgi:hypothetical protein
MKTSMWLVKSWARIAIGGILLWAVVALSGESADHSI